MVPKAQSKITHKFKANASRCFTDKIKPMMLNGRPKMTSAKESQRWLRTTHTSNFDNKQPNISLKQKKREFAGISPEKS